MRCNPSATEAGNPGGRLQEFGRPPDDLKGVVDLVGDAGQQARHRGRTIERQQVGRTGCPRRLIRHSVTPLLQK